VELNRWLLWGGGFGGGLLGSSELQTTTMERTRTGGRGGGVAGARQSDHGSFDGEAQCMTTEKMIYSGSILPSDAVSEPL
jgi:hypothetical protein